MSLGGLAAEFLSLEGAINDASYRATIGGLRNVSVATPLVASSRDEGGQTLARTIDLQIFNEQHEASLAIGDPFYNPNFALDAADFK